MKLKRASFRMRLSLLLSSYYKPSAYLNGQHSRAAAKTAAKMMIASEFGSSMAIHRPTRHSPTEKLRTHCNDCILFHGKFQLDRYISERQLRYVRYMLLQFRLSSVTLVRPTQLVEILGNIFHQTIAQGLYFSGVKNRWWGTPRAP